MLEGSGLEVRGIVGDQSTVKILESTIKEGFSFLFSQKILNFHTKNNIVIEN